MSYRLCCALVPGMLILACASPNPAAERQAYELALADPAAFRTGLAASCAELPQIDAAIHAAIAIGAPIYNAGAALGCYRIYEGTAYKILYRLDGRCPEAGSVLRAGLAQAEVDGQVIAKAWTLRHTFDTLLGEATQYGRESSL